MFQSIEKALNFLLSHDKISNSDYFSLQKYYRDLISSGSYDVDSITSDLKGLFDDEGYVNVILGRVNKNSGVSILDNDVVDEIIDFDDNDFSLSMNRAVSSNQSDSLDSNRSVSNHVMETQNVSKVLVDVSDFKREDRNYIKLDYSDGSVRIFENNLEHNGKEYTGEEIFTVLKNKYNQDDITQVMHQFTRDSIEIGLYDFSDLSNKNVYDNLNDSEKQLINIVKSQYPDKKVLSGPGDNMFVIQGIGENQLVQVLSRDGIYQVRPIIDNSINDSIDNDSSNSKGIQKTLSTQAGKLFSDSSESGFVMLFLFIFLAGIGSGIIFMIILNFMA